MNIAKFCIRHKVTTLLAVIMIAVFGVVYTTQLQMALLPNIEYPAAYGHLARKDRQHAMGTVLRHVCPR